MLVRLVDVTVKEVEDSVWLALVEVKVRLSEVLVLLSEVVDCVQLDVVALKLEVVSDWLVVVLDVVEVAGGRLMAMLPHISVVAP